MWCLQAIGSLSIGLAATAMCMPPATGATFGTVVAIGGQAADVALDEPRGVLYIANFTAARIDELSLADQTIRTSVHVAPQPSALALSPDGRYLVVAHFGNVQAPGTPTNALTVIDCSTGALRTLTLDTPPLGVAFGFDGLALIATTTEFLLLDPASGQTNFLDTVQNVSANTLPALAATPPVQIVAASLASSGDGHYIFGLTDSIRFVYDVAAHFLRVEGYTASPPMGPRVVSVARDGSYYAAGWGVFSRDGVLVAQFPDPAGLLAVGSHAIDSASGTIYAEIPQASAPASTPPMLSILDADNLTLREQLRLPENLTGRAVLNANADTLYGVSESGVLVLPVGSLSAAHRLNADHEDLVFQGSLCEHDLITQTLRITDPGGGKTAFALSTDLAGVTISPSSGQTPATVQVQVDLAAFQNRRGTVVGSLTLSSPQAVNLSPAVRILINTHRPDQRGTITDVPGKLAGVLADPQRDRFYILRQDRNQVLVFDGTGFSQIATLRTGATPTSVAMTFDRKYLLIGHDNSQLVYVYDLDSLQRQPPVVFPGGHYPRSIAASSNAILAASRVAGGPNTIDRINLTTQRAVTLTSLGVFQNSIALDTVLTAAPNGSSILAASSDGNLLLYDAAADTFTVSRKLETPLSGAYAASSFGQFLAGGTLLNASLVPTQTWSGSDFPSGFTFVDGQGLRLTSPQDPTTGSGRIEHVDLTTGAEILPTSLAEQTVTTNGVSGFTQALAPLANRNSVIALTVSGFTALAWNFDAGVAPPVIQGITNAADMTTNVAPGGLISVFGSNLSPTNTATQEMPLPTALGESCLTVNGAAIPMLFVSPGQINAQLPLHLEGTVTMTLYTPGGVSDDYFLNLLPAAPAIFESGTAGPLTGIPVVVKASNGQLVTPSNPIHVGDVITIYATGLGPTSPEVAAGDPAPVSPLAETVVSPDVRLGSVPIVVDYAGLAPGEVGVYQINARAQDGVPTGNQVPLTITQGGVTASATVRVVN
ncbi:MAG TPA: hypothetical protein VG675_08105 [Bryobacteraceae bacterium]|nr:hypothetical protein [Bryobacteraceae bacterium]